MTLYKNKYRIESARLKGWDYLSPGAYFVTICTKNRECYFGEIVDGEMILSDCGKIAQINWQNVPDHFDNIALDEFVVMPNHIHGILDRRDAINRVSTNDTNTNDTNKNSGIARNSGHIKNGGVTGHHNPMIHKNISRIIRWYKGHTSFEIRKFNPDFAWQSRFHDHIIRDKNELKRIRQYIMDNTAHWKNDNNYTEEMIK
jgi:putative transposase